MSAAENPLGSVRWLDYVCQVSNYHPYEDQNSVSFNLFTFDRALKKVPMLVECCAWALSIIFLQSNNKTWSQWHDLEYDGDAISVVPSL